MTMQISDAILHSIATGSASLFLGAGASLGARDARGANLPSGGGLATELRTTVLRDPHLPEWPLAMLCEIAGEQRAAEIAKYVRDRFSSATPTRSHRRIPWFRWRAIATTNYDNLVELSYRNVAALQNGTPVVVEQDLALLGPRDVPIIKLHGCCNQVQTLVLSMSDLYRRKREASLLFQTVEQLHLVGPVIYIGYSLSDQHILESIFELTARLGRLRQPIVFVGREVDDKWQRTWVERALRAEYVPTGFDGFMEQLVKVVAPPIGPSMIVAQPFSPCWADETSGHAEVHNSIEEVDGEWQCVCEYTITDAEGFACVFFERFDGPVDVSSHRWLSFELLVDGESERHDDRLEALKLESRNTLYPYLLSTRGKPRGEWFPVRLNLDEYREMVHLNRLVRVTLADNGHRALLGRKYRMGVRRIRFE